MLFQEDILEEVTSGLGQWGGGKHRESKGVSAGRAQVVKENVSDTAQAGTALQGLAKWFLVLLMTSKTLF